MTPGTPDRAGCGFPPWVYALVRTAVQAQEDGPGCNRDHLDAEGCDYCAWQAVLDQVPSRVIRQAFAQMARRP